MSCIVFVGYIVCQCMTVLQSYIACVQCYLFIVLSVVCCSESVFFCVAMCFWFYDGLITQYAHVKQAVLYEAVSLAACCSVFLMFILCSNTDEVLVY